MIHKENSLQKLKEVISEEEKIIRGMISLFGGLENIESAEEKRMISPQIISLKNSLEKANNSIPIILEKISLIRPLHPQKQIKKTETPIKNIETQPIKQTQKIDMPKKNFSMKNLKLLKKTEFSRLEKQTIKRIKKKEEKISKEKIRKPSIYVKTANTFFFNFSTPLTDKKIFDKLKKDLIKANLQFIPASYISVLLFTTILSIIAGIFLFLFFLFFNIGIKFPFITSVAESLGSRFLKVFWILFAVPIGAFLAVYFYPSLEKRSIENRINQELPFVTIHMSAIAGSMIDPSNIFSIIISTKEYPYVEKEFTKLINEINIYGYDLITALRNSAIHNPSKKLAELFNGLATTINSGGDLPEFFEKRAQSLLFEYRIEREKHTKSAETFMDIYISVVIAAPMILMLLLMMMKISGLGISLSTTMISLVMVLGVSMINILFLVFLRLKQIE